MRRSRAVLPVHAAGDAERQGGLLGGAEEERGGAGRTPPPVPADEGRGGGRQGEGWWLPRVTVVRDRFGLVSFSLLCVGFCCVTLCFDFSF